MKAYIRSLILSASIISATITATITATLGTIYAASAASSSASPTALNPAALNPTALNSVILAGIERAYPTWWDEEMLELKIYEEIMRDLDDWSDIDRLDDEILEALEDDDELDRDDELNTLDEDMLREAVTQAAEAWENTETHCKEDVGETYYANFDLVTDSWSCVEDVSPTSASDTTIFTLRQAAGDALRDGKAERDKALSHGVNDAMTPGIAPGAIAQGSSQTRRPAPQLAAAASNNIASASFVQRN